MPLVAACVIPSVLDLGPLRCDVDRVLAGLPPFEVAVVLAGGTEPMLHDVDVAHAPSPGGLLREATVATATDLLTAIARRGQAPRVRSRHLDGALGGLVLHLGDRGSDTCGIVAMTVPDRATADALDGVAVGLEAAIRSVDDDVVVIAAGDLAAVHEASAPSRAGDDDAARRWDEQAAAALAASDLPAFRRLGPDAAQAAGAAAWAPLNVLLGVLERAALKVATSTYEPLSGAGRIVATTTPTGRAA